jgi:Fe-S cluster biosynthesis and repair protein YggX
MARMIFCEKLGRMAPGLDKPPFSGELGERIYEHISAEAYALWQPQATLIINHYGLSMGDPEARQFLLQQMEEFFFGQGARMPEGWTPQGQGGKGGARRAK